MFLSHIDKELKVHFKEVYTVMIQNNNLKNNILSSNDSNEVPKILAYSHDFGKYNVNFQIYINDIKNNVPYTGKEQDKAHQLISAIFALFLADRHLECKELSVVCASIIFSHHGNLKDIKSCLLGRYSEEKFMLLIEKYRDFMKSDIDDIALEYKDIGYEEDVYDFFKEDLKALLRKYKILWRKYIKKISQSEDISPYIIHSLYYSALIEADKVSASDTKLPEIHSISYDEFFKIKEKMFDNKKNYRSIINKNIINNLKENYQNNIFTITSPTGSGKTITGVECAILLKELSNLNKIYYVLPFTSIINQSYDVIKKFFENKDSTYLLKYHSLSNDIYTIKKSCTKYIEKEGISTEEEMNFNQIELVMSLLHSGFTVTTFNQFLESLICAKNKMIKKLNNFNNSVILIDEIQCIPLKYLKIIEILLKCISEKLNIKIIIMTATKPFILNENSVELLDDYKKYFKQQNRTQISFVNNMNKINIDEFVQHIGESDEFFDNSSMIICNTIKSSIKMYKKIYNLPKINKEDIYYLSTNILPYKRKEIIDKIQKRLKNSDNVKLICTQLVEAGVDLDFNRIYRDIAPMPSIIQAAGRCNREGKLKNIGNVYIFRLTTDDGNDYSSYVYDWNSEIVPTMQCLEQYSSNYKNSIKEVNYLEVIEQYYNIMKKKYGEHQSSLDIFNNMIGGEWSINTNIGKFSLINNNGYVDIFIPYKDKGKELLQKYFDCLEIKDLAIRSEQLFMLKPEIQNYTISVPAKELLGKTGCFSNKGSFVYANLEYVDYIYEDVLGFKRNMSDGDEGLFI